MDLGLWADDRITSFSSGHMVGNKFLTLLSNMFTNINLTDTETGYKAFKAPLIKSIQIEEDRFGVEPEIIAKLARTGCRIYEVGISHSGRTCRGQEDQLEGRLKSDYLQIQPGAAQHMKDAAHANRGGPIDRINSSLDDGSMASPASARGPTNICKLI